jgi:hypothetical protein
MGYALFLGALILIFARRVVHSLGYSNNKNPFRQPRSQRANLVKLPQYSTPIHIQSSRKGRFDVSSKNTKHKFMDQSIHVKSFEEIPPLMFNSSHPHLSHKSPFIIHTLGIVKLTIRATQSAWTFFHAAAHTVHISKFWTQKEIK